ncbi:hypothetical protein [Rossellomorea aquimaris]|uniref:Uncharacterized protein n=1 Tax=Rossellomorea aquimaris TaxID=189382 RepID=A0A5D4TN46_9BACI|nr:hypothetical protein [Rossellomorea aquimaris]TYS77127.1 hypothetical protein FZC80_13575 [Rossellomorea aquimaris]
MTYRKERDRNLLAVGTSDWIRKGGDGQYASRWGLAAGLIKSVSALISPDRQMFPREKKALFPFILRGLFDPEGLGAEAGRIKSVSASISPDRQMFLREKKCSSFYSLRVI